MTIVFERARDYQSGLEDKGVIGHYQQSHTYLEQAQKTLRNIEVWCLTHHLKMDAEILSFYFCAATHTGPLFIQSNDMNTGITKPGRDLSITKVSWVRSTHVLRTQCHQTATVRPRRDTLSWSIRISPALSPALPRSIVPPVSAVHCNFLYCLVRVSWSPHHVFKPRLLCLECNSLSCCSRKLLV